MNFINGSKEYMKIYQVGGSIRDELLGIPNNDLDYAVECDSFETMKEYIENIGGKIFLSTPKYLTIRAKIGNEVADYTMCRKDSIYSDGRHPDYVEAGTIYDDLERRDFSINSLAKNIKTGEILDPHGGISDVKNGIIRATGNNPKRRIQEDTLRALRALRFSITKEMYIDDDLAYVISGLGTYSFTSVSTERIREELTKMFQYDTFKSFELLNSFFVMRELIEERKIWFCPTTKGK